MFYKFIVTFLLTLVTSIFLFLFFLLLFLFFFFSFFLFIPQELTDANEKYSTEKDTLHFKLVKVKHDKDQLKQQIKELQTQLQQNKHFPSANAGQLENVDKVDIIIYSYFHMLPLSYNDLYLCDMLCTGGTYLR